MDASPPTIRSETSILDLNDDCLEEVFAHMEPEQLTIVADVCTRFRENTMHSARTKCKEIKLLEKPSVLDCSKLRNFGHFIESIIVFGYRNDVEYQLRIMELLSLYCVGKSIKLKLSEFNITREVAVRMHSLLGRVRGLRFDDCWLHKLISEELSLWSTQLYELVYSGCELSIGEEQQAVVFQQKFPKLVTFSFDRLTDEEISGIKKFLQQNPQLKEIDVFGDLRCFGGDIFQSIAKYVPAVEKILFNCRLTGAVKYVGRLRDLKSLSFGPNVSTRFIQPVLREIASTNIALEHLDVILPYKPVQFMERVSKLQTLKTLQMTILGYLSEAQLIPFRKHLIEICKNSKELSKIWLLGRKLKITEDDLLELVQNAEKLQKFEYISGTYPTDLINISVDTFKKLVGIIERRPEKTPLTLQLPADEYTANIPVELTRAHCGILTLMIEKYRAQSNGCNECEFKRHWRCHCS